MTDFERENFFQITFFREFPQYICSYGHIFTRTYLVCVIWQEKREKENKMSPQDPVANWHHLLALRPLYAADLSLYEREKRSHLARWAVTTRLKCSDNLAYLYVTKKNKKINSKQWRQSCFLIPLSFFFIKKKLSQNFFQ